MAEITLRVLDGAERGRVFENLPTPVTVGREEGNTIQLNDERISRFHFKIQEDRNKIVLTDLESTNGTRVNGEDVQLRILRHGDVIALGRSVLLYGSAEQIRERLARLRRSIDEKSTPLPWGKAGDSGSSFDFDLEWGEHAELQAALHNLEEPELPERLSPGQSAQLSELIEYLHIRIRGLLESVQPEPRSDRVTLDLHQWQNLLDLQARLARYLRKIGEPDG